MSLLRREPPLTPDADEARAWATDELTKAVYRTEPSLWERIVQFLRDLLEDLLDRAGGAGPVLLPVVILVVVAIVVGVALLLGGPIRRRRMRATSVAVLDDDARTAEQLRSAADAAAASGDLALAVLERFRAVVRGLDERAILSDRAGRTAREAAVAAGARLPDHAASLRSAATLFDEVCYGSAAPGRQEYEGLSELDRAVQRARPTRTGELVAADDLVAPR